LEDLGVDENIIYLQEAGCGLNWNDLVQDRARRRAIVNAVMNLRFL
jgi:hypothetical protein